MTKLDQYTQSNNTIVKDFAIYAKKLYKLYEGKQLSQDELMELLDDKYKVQIITDEMNKLEIIKDIKTIIVITSALIQLAK